VSGSLRIGDVGFCCSDPDERRPGHTGTVLAMAQKTNTAARRDPFELAVIGGGNMGAALVGGLLAAGSTDPSTIAICEALSARREQLELMFPAVAVTSEPPGCRAAVLAVKPADIPAAATAAVTAGATRLLSIAAGVTTAAIEGAAASIAAQSEPVAVIRAMPNTPALVGEGASAIAAGSAAMEDDLAWAEGILGAVGLVVRVREEQLDAVTALSGSGPAYLFLVAESLIDAGVRAGLAEELSTALTTQLLVGSAALLAERGDPAALRVMVTSPGGTTAAGLRVLDERDVRSAFSDAVQAAAARSRELAGPS
jgi:pyrroline-5-carboxylate reductase